MLKLTFWEENKRGEFNDCVVGAKPGGNSE